MVTDLVVPFVSQYGIVDLAEDGRVTGFRSDPVLPYWVNGGVYVLEQAIRELLEQGRSRYTFPKLARRASCWRSRARSSGGPWTP